MTSTSPLNADYKILDFGFGNKHMSAFGLDLFTVPANGGTIDHATAGFLYPGLWTPELGIANDLAAKAAGYADAEGFRCGTSHPFRPSRTSSQDAPAWSAGCSHAPRADPTTTST